jgi:nucleotide-binding universal stress UspA family protein
MPSLGHTGSRGVPGTQKEDPVIERILFPTDGSPLSERALPAVELIAAAQRSRVYLVQAVPPPVWTGMNDVGYAADASISVELYELMLEELEQQAEQNLKRLAERLSSYCTPIQSTARQIRGSPAAALLDYEQEVHPDLVVMATHGRTGLARFVRGSVADSMVRDGSAPVLLVRSFGDEVKELKTAVVPLDGSALAEQALRVIEELAGKPLEQVFLLRIVDSAAGRADAWSYLEELATQLPRTRLGVDFDVRIGHPAELIRERAHGMDVVVMATHGRGGFDRFRHGSVATEILHESPAPVLLVRASPDATPFFTEAA